MRLKALRDGVMPNSETGGAGYCHPCARVLSVAGFPAIMRRFPPPGNNPTVRITNTGNNPTVGEQQEVHPTVRNSRRYTQQCGTAGETHNREEQPERHITGKNSRKEHPRRYHSGNNIHGGTTAGITPTGVAQQERYTHGSSTAGEVHPRRYTEKDTHLRRYTERDTHPGRHNSENDPPWEA